MYVRPFAEDSPFFAVRALPERRVGTGTGVVPYKRFHRSLRGAERLHAATSPAPIAVVREWDNKPELFAKLREAAADDAALAVETARVEFKAYALKSCEEVASVVRPIFCALLNAAVGRRVAPKLYLGVHDDGTVVGLHL